MVDEILSKAEEAMSKTEENLSKEFSAVRTGRASAQLLERINVDYFGVATPITQLASVKSPEAHMLIIEPWDKNILKDIEKAISSSDLGITPSNNGSSISLPFPAPTEERRKELVKLCNKLAEEAKVAIRNIRRDANAKVEKEKKSSEISEDDEHKAQGRIQKLTDKFIEKIESALAKKQSEVMEL